MKSLNTVDVFSSPKWYNISKFLKMLLSVNIFKILEKSQKISSICRFLKFSKNAPIDEHFLNLIFGEKSKTKKKQ